MTSPTIRSNPWCSLLYANWMELITNDFCSCVSFLIQFLNEAGVSSPDDRPGQSVWMFWSLKFLGFPSQLLLMWSNGKDKPSTDWHQRTCMSCQIHLCLMTSPLGAPLKIFCQGLLPQLFLLPNPQAMGFFCQGYSLSLSSHEVLTRQWGYLPIAGDLANGHQDMPTCWWACMQHVWGPYLLQVLCSLAWDHKVPSFCVLSHGGTA